MKLNAINRNSDGDYFFIYELETKRSINTKAKRKANEVIIVGVPNYKLEAYLDRCYKLSRECKTKKELKQALKEREQ